MINLFDGVLYAIKQINSIFAGAKKYTEEDGKLEEYEMAKMDAENIMAESKSWNNEEPPDDYDEEEVENRAYAIEESRQKEEKHGII